MRGWHNESHRHTLASKGVKTTPIERPVKVNGHVNVDASIANVIQTLNTLGFKTVVSCSGVEAEHPGNGCEHFQGYIAWFKADLTPKQMDIINKAADEAKLSFNIDPDKVGIGEERLGLFFMPGVRVGTNITKDGTSKRKLIKEANKRTTKQLGHGISEDWETWVDLRDEIEEKLLKQLVL